uniref:Fasciculation and elongation protein zeta-2-like n=1 Tax=Phallusia mammillata TaxID=59560 RepID=A0A6F9DCR9_9ASCI|nr:fasciculation and elongation protein zeta-2-like [Phallusia mammillata]
MEAPIAHIDEEWENFSSFSSGTQENVYFQSNLELDPTGKNLDDLLVKNDRYKSMEDLVHSFEETLASCFRVDCTDVATDNEQLTCLDDNTLFQNSIWKKITDNYGLVQPLNWETSHVRKLHIPALELTFKTEATNEKDQLVTDLEDSELAEQMDLHKMVEYNVYSDQNNAVFFTQSIHTDEAVMQTADEVIQELEQIMMKADDADVATDLEVQEQTGIIINDTYVENGEIPFERVCRQSIGSPSSQEEGDRATELKSLSITELNSICEGLDSEVKTLSTELLQQLNQRDELQFENEVRNSLISNVLEVQYKQEQFRRNNKISLPPTTKKFGRMKRSATADSVASTDGHYLTTAIPCNRGDLSIGNLQALNRLLSAIKADSEEVPHLLTSYILTVLCPAPVSSSQHALKL